MVEISLNFALKFFYMIQMNRFLVIEGSWVEEGGVSQAQRLSFSQNHSIKWRVTQSLCSGARRENLFYDESCASYWNIKWQNSSFPFFPLWRVERVKADHSKINRSKLTLALNSCSRGLVDKVLDWQAEGPGFESTQGNSFEISFSFWQSLTVSKNIFDQPKNVFFAVPKLSEYVQ